MDHNQTHSDFEVNTEKDERQFTKLNLFFIKSKHAFRQFKNHDYFQSRPVQMNKHQLEQKNNKQFVGSPTPYGISNAYDYICEQIAKNYLNKPQSSTKRLKTENEKQPFDDHNAKNTTFVYEKRRKTHFTLPNLRQSKKIDNLKVNLSSIKPIKEPITKIERERYQSKAEQAITLIFIDKLQALSKLGSYQLKLNIYQYIINTFLKTKINYHEITEEQFSIIKKEIIEIFQTEKEMVEYKDLVNLKSVKEIFQLLDLHKQNIIFKREIIRYFFIAKKDIYQYQFDKIKDEIKMLINYQFNKEINNQEIYIFDTVTGNLVTDLYQLMRLQGKFIFGTDQTTITIYRNYIKEKDAQFKLANRIKKWKSIVPQQKVSCQSFQCMTTEKYHKLFNSVQKKRDKFTKTKKKPMISLKSSQFIEKDKLFKDENIFQ